METDSIMIFRSRLACAPLLLLLVALTSCKDEDTRVPFIGAIPPATVVTGPVPLGFIVQDKSGSRVSVEVSVSSDRGRTFKPATATAGSPGQPIVVVAAPAGAQGTFSWDPIEDLGPGIHREVVVSFRAAQGVGGDTGVFTVDLTDRLDPIPGAGDVRTLPVAAPLPDDRVWVTGGERGGIFVSSGVIYDPVTNQVFAAPGLTVARGTPGYALLRGGQVLVAGGHDAGAAPSSAAETFRLLPNGTAQVTAASPLLTARDAPAVAALADGRAVVVGGRGAGGPVATVEVFTPATNMFTLAFTDATLARLGATATALPDGRVLVTGGVDSMGNPITTASLINATATGAVATDDDAPRAEHAAVRLPDGRVLVAGGTTVLGDSTSATNSASIYDPSTDVFVTIDFMEARRHRPGLAYAGGAAVAFCGSSSLTGGPTSHDTAERYDVATDRWTLIAGPSGIARDDAVAVATGPGRALVVGGEAEPEVYTPDASLTAQPFDPLVASVPDPRADHTATLLGDGTVLIVGGTDGLTLGLDGVERFDPATRLFSPRTALDRGRSDHAATDVGFGVLVVGGRDDVGLVADAELYDPGTNTWQAAGTLSTPRAGATAVLLGDGSVLVSGGVDAAGVPLIGQERWNPGTRTFSSAGSLSEARVDHRALPHAGHAVIGPGRGVALAPNDTVDVVLAGSLNVQTATGVERAAAGLALPAFGRGVVLVSGGEALTGPRADAAFLDARTIGGAPPVFLSVTRPLVLTRADHESVALASGVQVLLVGGRGQSGAVRDEGEVYTFANVAIEAGTADPTADRRAVKARVRHTATLLPNGRVLIVGGVDERGVTIAGAELFLP